MKKIILSIVGLFCSLGYLSSQQIGYTSSMDDTRYAWNPSMTGIRPYVQTQIFYRQQWLNFKGAPRTAYLGIQLPLLDYNMALGGRIISDKAGEVANTGIEVNYAYQLRGLLAEEGMLSIGIGAGISQISFGSNNLVFNDTGDGLIDQNRNSGMNPNFSAGLYYTTNTEYFEGSSSFFAGFAFHQLYDGNILISNANFKRERHLFGIIGTRIGSSYDYYIEPSFTFNYVNPEFIDLIVAAKFEIKDTFWAGMAYSTVNDIGFQGGIILNEFFNRDGQLRIGVLANLNTSGIAAALGPGFEFMASYLYDIE